MRLALLVFLFGGVSVFLSATETAAETRGFTIETGLEYSMGVFEELVYRTTTSNDLLSRLDWPLPPALGLRLSLSKEWTPWLLRGSLRASWALASTRVNDDDWNVTDSYGTLYTTIHSDSTAYLKSDWEATLEGGQRNYVNVFSFDTLLGVTYRQLNWEARDALQVNTTSTGATYYKQMTGMVLTYRQEWIIPFLHGQVGVKLGPWGGSLGLKFSPFMLCFAMDEHLARDPSVTFQDTGWGGFMVQPEITQEFWVDKLNAVGVQFRITKTWGVRGNSSYSTNGVTTSDYTASNYTSGMAFSNIVIALNYKTLF